MSESTGTTEGTDSSNKDGNESSETTSTAGDEFKAITSQDDLNKILNDRLTRERAKFADYKDVKAKAAEYDKLADANKSEIERATERVSKAEAEVAKVPTLVAGALRAHLVAIHEIAPERAELYLTASDPDLLLKQVAGLVDLDADRKKNGNRVTREGQTTSTSGSDDDGRAFVRQLFPPKG